MTWRSIWWAMVMKGTTQEQASDAQKDSVWDCRVTSGTGTLVSPNPTMPGIYKCQGEGWLSEAYLFIYFLLPSPSTYFSDFT